MYLGFEVLTAVVRSSIFWDVTPCSRIFGLTSNGIQGFISEKTELLIRMYVREYQINFKSCAMLSQFFSALNNGKAEF
jgi:hypothetical protein